MLSKASKIALYALVEMASRPEARVSAANVASKFEVSDNHVAKVLQQLARTGLLKATRGVGGGYLLKKPASDITMLDIVTVIEGPLVTDGCAGCPFKQDNANCVEHAATCNVHALLNELNTHARYTLESVTIATLARRGNNHAFND